ncbi:MAG: ABC transporter ATP-binding protein [Syntrophomonadaceae bacterium]|nr:ABC transporter ATP-binding protein [Syntrophomonadaceae bacterium]
MIQAENLTKIYRINDTEIKVLNVINLHVEKGEFIALQGPSGCGKSTLLNILGCLETATSGRVLIDGADTSKLNDDDLAKIRQEKIGYIFQAYNLIPTLSAFENVMLPMLFAGKDDGVNSSASKRATMLLKNVDMQHRLDHKPSALSGGEQQRVAIARALSNNPEILIGDELTGNLDSKAGLAVMEILINLNKEGQTIILATHDSTVANMANRIVKIKDGKILD